MYTSILAGDMYTYCITKLYNITLLGILYVVLYYIGDHMYLYRLSVQCEVGPFLNSITDLTPWHHMHDIMEF